MRIAEMITTRVWQTDIKRTVGALVSEDRL